MSESRWGIPCYSDQERKPYPSIAVTECDESICVEPNSLYAKTKWESERIVLQREDSIALRFATVFGISHKMRNDLLINEFIHRAIKECTVVLFGTESRRTFIHIQDAVSAYLFAVDHATAIRGEVFNVGSPSLNLSKLEIAQAIRAYVEFEIVNSSVPCDDKRNFEVSFEKIESLGYHTQYSLQDGIRELISLYSFYTPHSDFNTI